MVRPGQEPTFESPSSGGPSFLEVGGVATPTPQGDEQPDSSYHPRALFVHSSSQSCLAPLVSCQQSRGRVECLTYDELLPIDVAARLGEELRNKKFSSVTVEFPFVTFTANYRSQETPGVYGAGPAGRTEAVRRETAVALRCFELLLGATLQGLHFLAVVKAPESGPSALDLPEGSFFRGDSCMRHPSYFPHHGISWIISNWLPIHFTSDSVPSVD